jgi:hypothetical protein
MLFSFFEEASTELREQRLADDIDNSKVKGVKANGELASLRLPDLR